MAEEQSQQQCDEDSTSEDILMEYLSRSNVVLPRSYVLQAVERALEPPVERPLAGKIAEIPASYHGKISNRCADRSHLRLSLKKGGSVMGKKDVTVIPIMHEMRHCLLTGDWDGYKQLVSVLFESPNIERQHALSMVRSCFVLLFNHPNRTPELVDNFMTSCMKINDPSKRVKFLRECFLLRGWTEAHKCNPNDNPAADVKEEEEEEEMFFFSDNSSLD